jgi:WD40 repeat protein
LLFRVSVRYCHLITPSRGTQCQDLRTQPIRQRVDKAFSFSNKAQNNEISFQCVSPKCVEIDSSPNITWRATLDVSPDGKTYVTAGVGAIVEIRDLMTDEVIKDFGTEENVALFSPDGQSLMTQGSEGTRIWR